MPGLARTRLVLGLAAPLLLAGAAPAQSGSTLLYDAAVFLERTCLSPMLGDCGATEPSNRSGVSASQAILEATAPRLPLDLAGLLDLGPQVTGGASPAAPAVP